MSTSRQDIPAGRPSLGLLLAIVAAVALTVTFFCARYAGIKEGQRQAREKIEQGTDLTAGPRSLLQ